MEGGDRGKLTLTRITATKNVSLNRYEAETAIDAAADRVRSRFATPGKHVIYSDKRAEAARYLEQVANGTEPHMEEYPYLSAEIGMTAETAMDLAELWLWMDSLWKGAAAAIEQISLGGKGQVRLATSQTQIDSIKAETIAILDGIGDKPPERPKQLAN